MSYKSAEQTIEKITDTVKLITGIVAIVAAFKLTFRYFTN